MAQLDILVYPDPRLRTKAEPVVEFDADLQQLVDDMAETMYAAPGIGLAAIQVNRPVRVLVVDISEAKNDLNVLINPKIVDKVGEIECEEGCLSVPEVYAPVQRASQVTVSAQKPDGEAFSLTADGLLAVCIQHEMDHLEGIVFVDYLSRLKRDRIRKKLEKEQRRSRQTEGKSTSRSGQAA